jgi:hypothetical protein
MQHVLVIDKNKMFLMPCRPARARELWRKGKAAVYKRFPFKTLLQYPGWWLKQCVSIRSSCSILKFQPFNISKGNWPGTNKGKKLGTYVGRVSVRKSGSFKIKTEAGTIQGISWKPCSLLQRADGRRLHRILLRGHAA